MKHELKEYLQILEVAEKKPSLDYLHELVQAQIRHFPYENGSKLIQSKNGIKRIATLEEHLDGHRKFGFGSTCYAQSVYFKELLEALGYEVQLQLSSVKGAVAQHASCLVNVDSESFIVENGLMDSFCGPFPLMGEKVQAELGGRTFYFLPDGKGGFRIEIYRGKDELHVLLQSERLVRDSADLRSTIEESFSADSFSMTSLEVGRRGNPYCSLWNSQFIRTQSGVVEKTSLKSPAEMKKILREEMSLPHYPIEEVLEILAERGKAIF